MSANNGNAESPHPAGDAEAPATANRREALKKAAVASAVAGTLWAAPRVEGFSLLPDYAAAGTATPTGIRLQFNSPGPNVGGDVFSGAPYTTGTPPITVTGSGSTNAVATLNAPLGNAGNVTANLGPVPADADKTATITVTFNVDPPFNKCRVTGGGRNFHTNWFDSVPGVTISPGPGAAVPNTSGTFNVTGSVGTGDIDIDKIGSFWVDVACD